MEPQVGLTVWLYALALCAEYPNWPFTRTGSLWLINFCMDGPKQVRIRDTKWISAGRLSPNIYDNSGVTLFTSLELSRPLIYRTPVDGDCKLFEHPPSEPPVFDSNLC